MPARELQLGYQLGYGHERQLRIRDASMSAEEAPPPSYEAVAAKDLAAAEAMQDSTEKLLPMSATCRI